MSGCVPQGPSSLEGNESSEAGSTDGETDPATETTDPTTGTETSESETGAPTTETETTDTDSTDTDPTDTDPTDTDGETGEELPPEPELTPPLESDTPCPAFGADPNQVIGAYARDPYLDQARLHFLRADGSSFVIDEQTDTYFGAVAAGEQVLVLSQGDCSSQSVARLVERDTGAELWTLDLPHGFAQGRPGRSQGDGRFVLNGSNCESFTAHFMVIEDGQLLDVGEGSPSPERVGPGNWLPLRRSFEEAESIWLWRNVQTMQEHEPVFERAPDTGRPIFLASGALVYFSEIEGELSLVVEDPQSAQLIDLGELAQLAEQGWSLRLAWTFTARVSPYAWDSQSTLIRALGPRDELRDFELTPELELFEVTPSLPEGQTMLPCTTPNLDAFGGMQLPLFDGEYVWLWDHPQPGEWERLGLPFTQLDSAGAIAFDETLYMRSRDYGDCDIDWPADPEPSLAGGRLQYLRGEGLVVPPADQAHVIDPSASCVAYATEGGRDLWQLHEIETNTSFALPAEIGPGSFFWLN